MKLPRVKNQSGMTLIELLIALTITAALMGLIVGFSVDKLEQSSLQSAQNDLLTNAETGLNRVTNDIRLATSADDNNRWEDANAPGAPANELSWQSDSDTVVLATATQDGSGNIIFDDAHDYIPAKDNIVYFLNGGTLYRRVLANPVSGNSAITTCPASDATSACPVDADVLDDVSSLNIEYFNALDQQVDPASAHSIRLSVTLKRHIYGQDVTVSYTTRMVFRNG